MVQLAVCPATSGRPDVSRWTTTMRCIEDRNLVGKELSRGVEDGFMDHRLLCALELCARRQGQDPTPLRSLLATWNETLDAMPSRPRTPKRSPELEAQLDRIRRKLNDDEYFRIAGKRLGVKRNEKDDVRVATSQIGGIVNVLLTFAAVFLAAFFTSRTIASDYGIRVLIALPFAACAGFAEAWFFARDLLWDVKQDEDVKRTNDLQLGNDVTNTDLHPAVTPFVEETIIPQSNSNSSNKKLRNRKAKKKKTTS